MATWQIHEARARFSELLDKASSEGPQTITRHGTEWAVVLSIKDYRALISGTPTLKSLLLGGPKVDDYTIERDRDTGRNVAL